MAGCMAKQRAHSAVLCHLFVFALEYFSYQVLRACQFLPPLSAHLCFKMRLVWRQLPSKPLQSDLNCYSQGCEQGRFVC